MRRYWPHIVAVLASIVSLAIIWSIEPPITFQPKRPSQMSRSAGKARDYFVRLEATQPLTAAELVVKIAWDKEQIKAPRVWHAPLSRQVRPRARIENGEMTISFRPMPRATRRLAKQGKMPLIDGQGRLARLGFRRVGSRQEIGPDALRIVEAVAVLQDGREVPLTDLQFVPYKPPHRREKARRPQARKKPVIKEQPS
ncbi:MAG: hypothetical protein P9L99_17390 [Candidatus Lernaella stagnicola]|nr:hypothetical protein [Candidatus Lernaella stagnicola]